jgi:isochorismate synthase
MVSEQKRSRKRHEQILDAALRVFAKRGYQDAAVDEIAAESATSKGGVYFHFPGKQAIFMALLDRAADRLRGKIEEAIARETEPVARADAALQAVFNSFASHRALARLFMIEAMGGGKDFQRRIAGLHDEFAGIIKVHLDEAVKHGVIDPIDTQVTATAWFGALNEIVTRWLITGEPKRLEDAYASLRPLLIRSVGASRSAGEANSLKDLRRVLAEAVETARTSEKRLVSRTFEVARGFDPITLFENGGSQRILWQQPSEGFAMAGLGAVETHEAMGSGRFGEIRGCWHELIAATDGEAATELNGTRLPAFPMALAAFAFTSAHRHETAMPDGALVVPHLLFLQLGFTHAVNVTLPATASGEDIDAVAADVTRLLEARPAASGVPQEVELVREVSEEQWADGIEAILASVEAGEVEKVVQARTVRAIADRPFAVGAVLRALAERNPRATIFAAGRNETCFLGATPERLVSLSDGRAKIDCLAGTIRLPGDASEAEALADTILHDSKELHEHEVVARAIRESLAPVCASVEAPERPSIKRTADVQHLHTPITATTKPGVELFDLVERLHPTPAMGGYPREAAVAKIGELESFDRGWYASPVGWVDAAGNGDFAVAIRSALIEGNRARLYAGNGIVEGSDPAKEFEETELKLRAMLWALRQE